ncbi:unnamed protein product [Trichobilharzia regenti]|nr:unnamed protein product [Trichobilharzia regenti]
MISAAIHIANKLPDIGIQLWATALLKGVANVCGDTQEETRWFTEHDRFSQIVIHEHMRAMSAPEHALIYVGERETKKRERSDKLPDYNLSTELSKSQPPNFKVGMVLGLSVSQCIPISTGSQFIFVIISSIAYIKLFVTVKLHSIRDAISAWIQKTRFAYASLRRSSVDVISDYRPKGGCTAQQSAPSSFMTVRPGH